MRESTVGKPIDAAEKEERNLVMYPGSQEGRGVQEGKISMI